MRLSLIAMVLCLCAAWPGHGLAWGYGRVGESGGDDARGSAEPGGRGGTV